MFAMSTMVLRILRHKQNACQLDSDCDNFCLKNNEHQQWTIVNKCDELIYALK